MDPSIILLRGTFYNSDLRRMNPSSDLSGENSVDEVRAVTSTGQITFKVFGITIR